MPTRDVLEQAHCWEPATDVVAGQPQMTDFKQSARLHQATWREANGYPIGSQPYRPTPEVSSRATGSRLEHQFAVHSKANMVSAAARAAMVARLNSPQRHQTLNRTRLCCDLLSSMPLCFNLFGPLAENLDLARQVIPAWFPELPGIVRQVHLEWSPGRLEKGRFLENRTAFDAAIELDLSGGGSGVLGIETKYHEHAKPEKPPGTDRLARYRHVARRSGAFHPEALDAIPGSAHQQIWQDHLLALSMQGEGWDWASFVVVYPARNTSYSSAVREYQDLLVDSATFGWATLEDLLNTSDGLAPDLASPLVSRYLW